MRIKQIMTTHPGWVDSSLSCATQIHGVMINWGCKYHYIRGGVQCKRKTSSLNTWMSIFIVKPGDFASLPTLDRILHFFFNFFFFLIVMQLSADLQTSSCLQQ